MKNVKILVLGAGPAGLAFANRLLQLGENSVLVLEKEQEAGGLCRSEMVDGTELDIGGGHFLDTRRPAVNKFLFDFMPENEWNIFDRNSKIDLGGKLIDHPIEANIYQMDVEDQVAYLKSIAAAGCNVGKAMPENFVDWIYWKLGEKIANDYMLPYNRKMFAEDLNSLGTYWLEKLPNVSFDDTLRSCLEKKPYGQEPGHSRFYYPKAYGYGELWRRMAKRLGDRLEYGVDVKSLDFEKKVVNGQYQAEKILVTIPWPEIQECVEMPDEIRNNISALVHSSVCVQYQKENLATDAQWIYCPDPQTTYHRILNRRVFCTNSRGYWTETNLCRWKEDTTAWYYINQYAYPLNTIHKPEAIRQILDWSAAHQVYGLGRWGEWEHFNSDVVVERALHLAQEVHNHEK